MKYEERKAILQQIASYIVRDDAGVALIDGLDSCLKCDGMTFRDAEMLQRYVDALDKKVIIINSLE